MEIKEIPEEDVNVKISICPQCNGTVRAAVEHRMTKKSKSEFQKEAFEYNLNIKTIQLLEYRKNTNWCKCD